MTEDEQRYSIAEAEFSGRVWHIPGADGAPLCGTVLDQVERRYLSIAMAPGDQVCNACLTIWHRRQEVPAGAGDQLDVVRQSVDELAGMLAGMPADDQASWLVSLCARIDRTTGDDVFDQTLARLVHTLRERQALGHWPGAGTGQV